MTITIAELFYGLLTFVAGVIATVGSVYVIFKMMFNIGAWKGGIENRLEGLEKDVTWIKGYIVQLPRFLPSDAVDSKSPRTLSELGKNISREIDAKKLVKSLVPILAERSKGLEEYDVQKLCYDYVHMEFEPTDEIDRRLKGGAFNNGVSRWTVLEVLAIELRDALLKLSKR